MSFLLSSRKVLPRSTPNPLDKSTIVSIFPKSITEFKPTIQPGRFDIPSGSYEKPSLLVIGPSSWWKEFDEDQPLLEIPQSSIIIANSVVQDYCNGLLGCNMDDVKPGLFFIPGAIDLITLVKEHKKELDRARANQKRWYETLVGMADVLWARSNGNPLAISDDMKLAASELGLKDKSWLRDTIISTEMSPCSACGNLRNTNYPVCQHCHTIIDKKKFDELGLKVAV